MNKAINREELRQVLYKGRADLMYVHGFYPDLEGGIPAGNSAFRRCTATTLRPPSAC